MHILPVGWEFDRPVLPFQLENKDPRKKHAHRVHLVVPGSAGGRDFPARIREALEKEGIEVVYHEVDREKDGRSVEFQSTVGKVAEICHLEAYRNGNDVHINISSGSKIGAFAAGLGGMAYLQTGRIHVYYVRPDTYTELEKDPKVRERKWREHGMSIGLNDILDLAVMPLVQYNRVELQILAFLRTKGGRASKQQLLEHLIPYHEAQFPSTFLDLLPPELAHRGGLRQGPGAAYKLRSGKPVGHLRVLQNKALGRLRGLLRRLVKEHLVTEIERGRERHVQLTQEGEIFSLLAQDEVSHGGRIQS